MILIKSKAEMARMREAGKILASCHRALAPMVRPGVTTLDIDQFVEEYLRQRGATPEQKGYQGYPFATCASINDVICHGFPNKRPLVEGDIVTIDMVVNLDGWLADSAWSYAVGSVSPEAKSLLETAHRALQIGIETARVGNRLGDISHAIQSYSEGKGYSVVRQFIGHGIGKDMHEDPQVPHFGPPGVGVKLREGMVFTIEPMINIGAYTAKIDEDGWTARTTDGSLSAQYEHTVAITDDGPWILTDSEDL